MMVAAWLLLGVGMGLGLYDAAFGALGRIYGDNARKAITGITLIAGFASTVGWPLSSFGLDAIGWRGTCFAWAAAHMLIGLPLNMLFLPKTEPLRQTWRSAVTSGTSATGLPDGLGVGVLHAAGVDLGRSRTAAAS